MLPCCRRLFSFSALPKNFFRIEKKRPSVPTRIVEPNKVSQKASQSVPKASRKAVWDGLGRFEGRLFPDNNAGRDGRTPFFDFIFIFFLAFQRKTDEPANAMSVVIVNVVARRNAQFLSAIVHLSNERIL